MMCNFLYIGNRPKIDISEYLSDSIDLDDSKTAASSKAVSTLNKKIISLSDMNCPIGCVIMYSGEFGGMYNRHPIDYETKRPIYDWCLCDGIQLKNNTSFFIPDLRGRMIIGTSEEYPLNSYGGNTDLSDVIIDGTSLTTAQLAVHAHGYRKVLRWNGWNGSNDGNDCKPPTDGQLTDTAGKSLPHTHTISTRTKHLPPYYSLAYIIRIPKIEYPEITDKFIEDITRLHNIVTTIMPNCTNIEGVL